MKMYAVWCQFKNYKQLDARRSLSSHNLSLFPYTSEVLLTEVKIIVVSFTFDRQKSMSEMLKQNANLSSCFQHMHFYHALNATLIANPVSNSEQTNKSFVYKSDENNKPKNSDREIKTTSAACLCL